MTHSWLLAVAYGAACALWLGVSRIVPLWRDVPRPRFARPWRELAVVACGVVGVVLLGQLWSRGIRFEGAGPWGPFAESMNQFIIFVPVLAVPIVRRQGWASAWVRWDRIAVRLAIGFGLALVALLLYSTLERGAPSWADSIRGVFSPERAPFAVQVLGEDLAIAILFVRLAAAIGSRRAIVGVAALFALAHVPSMMVRGDTALELAGLLRDFVLSALVVSTAWRSADVAWVWPLHYSLDMTQFLSRSA